jgi:hypothetical protein
MRRNIMTISVKLDKDSQTITWTSDRCADQAVARISEMSEGVKLRAMYHGLNARGTDAGAMAMDHWDGKDKPKRYAFDHEKLARIKRVVDHLNNPATGWDWDLRPSADPLAGKSATELAALIAAAQSKLASLGIAAALDKVEEPKAE